MAEAGTPIEVVAARLAAIFLAAQERIEREEREAAEQAKRDAA